MKIGVRLIERADKSGLINLVVEYLDRCTCRGCCTRGETYRKEGKEKNLGVSLLLLLVGTYALVGPNWKAMATKEYPGVESTGT